MHFKQVLRVAEALGLVVDQQEAGFRIIDVDGRLLGSHLSHEQVEVFVTRRRYEHHLHQCQWPVLEIGCAFPPS
jgi:hypothetical protein